MSSKNEHRFGELFKKQEVSPQQAAVDEQGQLVANEYTVYPRRFLSFSIPKSIGVGVAAFLLNILLSIFVFVVGLAIAGDPSLLDSVFVDGYTGLDAFSTHGALITFGGVAVAFPALILARLIVRDRPFSSYSSSRGGWDWSIFFKSFGISLVVFLAFTIAQLFLSGDLNNPIVIRYSIAGFIISLVLLPFQCLSEEYIFRGYIMQFFGSIFKIPVIAIIVQALVFAAVHPYNILGVIAVFCTGVIFGILAWYTRGLEASSASHIVNNYISFFLAGMSIQALSTEVEPISLVISIVMDLIVAVLIIVLGKRGNWFKAKKDEVTPYNNRIARKKSMQPPMQAQ